MRRILAATAITCILAASPDARADFGDITLLGQTALSSSGFITDVWGYVDPNTNKEYAIAVNYNSPARLYVVDVSNPAVPAEVAHVDLTGTFGFDVKVYDHYAYVCDGNGTGKDSRIVDIANPLAPVQLAGGFESAHNIAISDDGYMFLQRNGMSVYDVGTDPENPDSLWRSANSLGHDSTPIGNKMVWDFGGNDLFARLWDYSNPDSLVLLAEVLDPGVQHFHGGDITEDGNYLYVCDEDAGGTETDIWVFDISNLASPALVAERHLTDAIVHNLYIIGDLAFISHYTRGFVTMDVSTPDNPQYADKYDTNISTGDTFDGAFGVYPYFPSGIIVVSDWDNGLFVFSVEGHNPNSSVDGRAPAASTMKLLPNVPNPFQASTSVRFALTEGQEVELAVYDVAGRHVRTLVDEWRGAGGYDTRWDGSNQHGQRVASGVYLLRLKSARAQVTRRMVLLR